MSAFTNGKLKIFVSLTIIAVLFPSPSDVFLMPKSLVCWDGW